MGAWRAAVLAAEFGFSVVGSFVGGLLVGLYLDRQLGTAPLFFLLGIAGGFVFSIYLIYVIYRLQLQPGRGPRSGRRAIGTQRQERHDR
jgi:ATP synthase protein I